MNKKWVVSLLFICSCTLYPKYERELEFETPSSWRVESCVMNELGNIDWWKQFNDPILDQYIQEAMIHNQDLQVAVATVDAFIAQLGIARSQLYPQLNGNASVEREKVSENSNNYIPGNPVIGNFYELILNASYQVDIWGQIRSTVDAAKAQLLASIEAKRTVILTLVRTVATTYIQMRKLDKQLCIAFDTQQAREFSLQLAMTRFEFGLTSMQQVEQAKSELEDAKTVVDQIQIQIAVAEDLLCFLTGKAPITPERGKLLDEIEMPPCVPSYLPSELLNQRPDILLREQELIAFNAQIGVARANFFPNIALTGQLGVESFQLSNLFTKPSSLWEYGLSLLQDIFTGGKLTNQLYLTEAQKRAALHKYESTVLNAFKEVNDSLISHRIAIKLVQDQKNKTATLKHYLRLADLRYQNGQTDYLTFLDAERQYFRALLDYEEALAKSFTTLIDIYASLGGGWVVDLDERFDRS